MTHLQGFVSKNRHQIFHRCLIAIRNIYSLHHHRLLAAVAEGEHKPSVVVDGYAHLVFFVLTNESLLAIKFIPYKRKQNNATTSKNKQKDKVPLDVLLNSITKITSPSDDDTP